MAAVLPRELVIDLDSLDERDLADVRAIALEGGCDLAEEEIDLTNPPIVVLTGLIYVTKRRHVPHITPDRCVRWAIDASAALAGGA